MTDLSGLNCPSLERLECINNLLADLSGLECPSLESLFCDDNPLVSLNGFEFCSELRLICRSKLELLPCKRSFVQSVIVLESHLPKLKMAFRPKH